jgi:hypothetical protein
MATNLRNYLFEVWVIGNGLLWAMVLDYYIRYPYLRDKLLQYGARCTIGISLLAGLYILTAKDYTNDATPETPNDRPVR